MATAVRPFNALDGNEVMEAILREIRNQLQADCRFRRNIGYPTISWRWKLAVDAYPMEPGKFEIEVAKQMRAAEAEALEADAKPVAIDFQGGTTAAAPVAGVTADAVRREAGLPLPLPRRVAGPVEGTRVTVDAPEVPHILAEAGAGERARTDVPGAAGMVARSVAIRTRANPGGVEVSPAPGTAPSAEDLDRLSEEEDIAQQTNGGLTGIDENA